VCHWEFIGDLPQPYYLTDGIALDPDKVAVVNSWPPPRTLWALQGFLSVMGYYQKFIAKYRDVAWPLTAILKWDTIYLSEDAERAFYALKQILMFAPLLQLPDVDRRIVVECDASGLVIGVVLLQGDDPIAFFSRDVAAQHAKMPLPAYECELIELVKVVRHLMPYLWGSFFSHPDISFLPQVHSQPIAYNNPFHTWVSKLFVYDFSIEYRQGKLNVVDDALSHRHEDTMGINAISNPSFAVYDAMCTELAISTTPPGWSKLDGLLLFKGCALLPAESSLWPHILERAHTMGHEGGEKTFH
jgi:hypothetical protein